MIDRVLDKKERNQDDRGKVREREVGLLFTEMAETVGEVALGITSHKFGFSQIVSHMPN